MPTQALSHTQTHSLSLQDAHMQKFEMRANTRGRLKQSFGLRAILCASRPRFFSNFQRKREAYGCGWLPFSLSIWSVNNAARPLILWKKKMVMWPSIYIAENIAVCHFFFLCFTFGLFFQWKSLRINEWPMLLL